MVPPEGRAAVPVQIGSRMHGRALDHHVGVVSKLLELRFAHHALEHVETVLPVSLQDVGMQAAVGAEPDWPAIGKATGAFLPGAKIGRRALSVLRPGRFRRLRRNVIHGASPATVNCGEILGKRLPYHNRLLPGSANRPSRIDTIPSITANGVCGRLRACHEMSGESTPPIAPGYEATKNQRYSWTRKR